MESLQAALKESQANADRVEQSLTERFRQTSSSLATAQVSNIVEFYNSSGIVADQEYFDADLDTDQATKRAKISGV